MRAGSHRFALNYLAEEVVLRRSGAVLAQAFSPALANVLFVRSGSAPRAFGSIHAASSSLRSARAPLRIPYSRPPENETATR
jgi:hypothetical protein